MVSVEGHRKINKISQKVMDEILCAVRSSDELPTFTTARAIPDAPLKNTSSFVPWRLSGFCGTVILTVRGLPLEHLICWH